MKKQNIIPLVVFCILILEVLVVPVSGGLTIAEEGAKITTTIGATSPVIQITGSPIAAVGTIEIDVSTLRECFSSHSLEAPNIEVHSTAASPVVWTPSITNSGNNVTLTSAGGPMVVGKNITVTFKGTTGNPWIANSGDIAFTVPVTRTDTSDTAEFNFEMNTIQSGLTITDGAALITTTGSTSPVITIIDSPITAGGTITIDVTNLRVLFAGTAITNANVEVHSTAAPSVGWNSSITNSGQTLRLKSSGGPTVVGDMINLTFKGTEQNPWKEGNDSLQVTAIRDDTHNTAVFTVQKNIPFRGSLMITDGAMITTTTGASSPVITITNEPIARNGTITINTTKLNVYVVGGNVTTANVVITDTAAAANWTGSVAGDNLILTSHGGATAIGEKVCVTFTGAAGAAWIANTGAKRTIPLIATRGDTLKISSFSFVIDIGGRPVANFSASPLSAMAPATITFIDKSSRNPLKWNWSFGDGTYSELQNPSHYYTTGAMYTISLNATNARGSNTTELDYLEIFNGAVRQANTAINGLTITSCGGPQFITVNTTILPAALVPNNSVLEIQPPADSGFKNITIFALNEAGFSRTGNLITGSPTGVHLVSEDIPPPSIFSDYVGSKSSLNYSIDLPSYPCNAILRTTIREGVTAENTASLHKISSGQTPEAVPKGTAYTATITKTNFPSSALVKFRFSINSSWKQSQDPTSIIFFWRIAEDGNSGQIHPTHYLSQDPLNKLNFYEADSPLDISTLGISAFTGNNNPFQLITLTAAAFIQPQDPAVPEKNADNQQASPSVTAMINPTVTGTQSPVMLQTTATPESVNAKLTTPAEGMTSAATQRIPQPAKTNTSVPTSAMSIMAGMVQWVVTLLAKNIILVVVVIILIAGFFIYEWKQRRSLWK